MPELSNFIALILFVYGSELSFGYDLKAIDTCEELQRVDPCPDKTNCRVNSDGVAYCRDVGHFNCGRYGQNCKNEGTCELESGKCVCPLSYAGYACQESSLNLARYCSIKCENGGKCRFNPKETCLCPEGYVGDRCQHNRINIECNALSISIKFAPIEPFSGLVFVGNDQDNTSCRLTKQPGDIFYTGVFHKSEECDSIAHIDLKNGHETFKKVLHILYNGIFLDENDLSLNVSCVYSSKATSHTGIGQIGGSLQFEDEKEDTYKPARLSVLTNPEKEEITRPVKLGQRAFLYNYLTDDKLFKALYVDHCTAIDPFNGISVSIIEFGCPTTRARNLFFSGAMRNSHSGITHDFKIFRLDSLTTTLTISCSVVMCRDGSDPTCALPVCSGFSPLKRKKRQISDDDVNYEQVTQTTIVIVDSPLKTYDLILSDFTDFDGFDTNRGSKMYGYMTFISTAIVIFFHGYLSCVYSLLRLY